MCVLFFFCRWKMQHKYVRTKERRMKIKSKITSVRPFCTLVLLAEKGNNAKHYQIKRYSAQNKNIFKLTNRFEQIAIVSPTWTELSAQLRWYVCSFHVVNFVWTEREREKCSRLQRECIYEKMNGRKCHMNFNDALKLTYKYTHRHTHSLTNNIDRDTTHRCRQTYRLKNAHFLRWRFLFASQ